MVTLRQVSVRQDVLAKVILVLVKLHPGDCRQSSPFGYQHILQLLPDGLWYAYTITCCYGPLLVQLKISTDSPTPSSHHQQCA